MKEVVFDQISAYARGQPVIVFCHGEKEKDWIDYLTTRMSKHYLNKIFTKMMDTAYINTFNQSTKGVTSGVFLVKKELYRGFDVRM